jgi:hypothetical protein
LHGDVFVQLAAGIDRPAGFDGDSSSAQEGANHAFDFGCGRAPLPTIEGTGDERQRVRFARRVRDEERMSPSGYEAPAI